MPDNTADILTSPAELYGADYYASHCGPIAYSRDQPEWAEFFGGVAEEILRSLQPGRVFDAGCAHGFLLEALWDRGIEAWGRDISAFAISEVRADLVPFVQQGSIADPIAGRYDLVTCIEVLEHMSEAEAIRAIAAMAAVAPRVLFSSSPSDRTEPTHINVQPVIWWLQRFAEAGLAPVADYDATFLTPHAVLFEWREDGRSPADLSTFAALVRQRMLVAEHRLRLAESQADLARQATAYVSAIAEAAQAERSRLEPLLARARQERDQVTADYKAVRLRHKASLTLKDDAIAALEAEIVAEREARRVVETVRDVILSSTMWRATGPVRRVGSRLPLSWRRPLRRIVRASYWLLTLQFRRRMAEWRSAHAGLALPLPEPAPEPPPPETEYERWVRRNDRLTDADRAAIRTHIDHLPSLPLISVIMPTYETPERLLREAIASVRAQLYPHWQLCIADDASPSDRVVRVLTELAAEEPRLIWMRRDSNGHIAAATNSALSLASGEFVALMDHDDLLPEQALYEVAVELNAHPDADLVYTDEDHIDGRGRRSSPYFKTDWNIDLLLGHNMISHLGVYRRSLLNRIGGIRGGALNGSQDYDLALRTAAASAPGRIRHIPAVLYHWRRMEDADSSFSQAQLDRCIAAAHRAIGDYLEDQGHADVAVLPAPSAATWTRTRWPLPDPAPRVTLIVPTRDRSELVARCAAGILHRTDYPDIELLIVDNDSTDPESIALLARLQNADRRVRVIPFHGPFNYSALNNAAVREASGEIVVLVNNDIDVIESGWLREMVSHAVRPDVGAVGAKLLYGDGRIQHAGTVLGVGTHTGGPGVAGHFGHGAGRDAIGYFGQFVLTREVAAVTAACIAMRREVYEAVGGLDEAHLPVSFNDVDLCLRIREMGLRIIWTPFAELYHLESSSRGADLTPEQVARAAGEADYMRERWGPVLDNDPFYNPNFDHLDHNFRLATPPGREKPWQPYLPVGSDEEDAA